MLGWIKPGTFNVLQLAIGCLFIFFAFNSQGAIEQTVVSSKNYNLYEHAGYVSGAIIYGIFTFANFIGPPIVGILGPKWAMVVGCSFYGIFEFGFLFLNEFFLYFSSALIGIAAAIIISAQGKYIALNSTEETAGKHTAIYWAVFQLSAIGGGIFLYCVFSLTKDDDDIEKSTVRLIYSVFTVISIVGILIFAFLRMPSDETQSLMSFENDPEEPAVTKKELLVSMFKLLRTKRMLLLAIPFIYTGIEATFISSIYPTCISYTQAMGENTKKFIALNSIAAGFGQAFAGFGLGIFEGFARRIGRPAIIIAGSIIHLFVFVAVFLNFPKESPLHKTHSYAILGKPSLAIALACGFFLGIGDACWNTQIFSFLISKYKRQSAEAVSIHKFFQCLLTSAAFFSGTLFELHWHLLILVICGIIACVGFVFAERLPPDENNAIGYDNIIADGSLTESRVEN